MKTINLAFLLFVVLAGCMHQDKSISPPSASSTLSHPQPEDPYLWLEEVTGERSLAWVADQNRVSTNRLTKDGGFDPLRKRLLAIYDSKEKLALPYKRASYYYNFWRDDVHVRGIWRRTSPEEYRKDKPSWETVLDLDALSATEKENWVWKGSSMLFPKYERALISLSRGGADATVTREYDVVGKQFVQDGFILPEAKSDVTWRDIDTVYVGTDFGPGSLTTSGYARVIKEWKRGTPLSSAKALFEGQPGDVAVGAAVDHDHGHTYEWISRAITFFSNESFLRQGDQWVKIEKPADAELGTFGDQLLIRLRTDWPIDGKTYPAGALLSAPLQDYLQGKRDLAVVFEPGPRKSLDNYGRTKNYLLINELDNVKSRLYSLKWENHQWSRQAIPAPEFGSLWINAVVEEESDEFFLGATDFLTPSSLKMGVIGKPELQQLKSSPAFFEANGLEVSQHEATSKDGTRIPYFQVSRTHAARSGPTPTLLTAYGGFEVSITPYYNSDVGAAWLEAGNVYVVANIRGGGEFGPPWHQAAVKQNRQNAYDDFAAVAEDLHRRKVTSPRHLGIMGGSNGGLLVGVAFTQHPELYRAVVCSVPLLDMSRYHTLLAGASWMGEYGDPTKSEEWAFLSKYSPYQNVQPGRTYPHILFTTSTRDDRVHPGHARKMMAKMSAQGHPGLLYYENTEGGHAGAADDKQHAFMSALEFTFLRQELE